MEIISGHFDNAIKMPGWFDIGAGGKQAVSNHGNEYMTARGKVKFTNKKSAELLI